jgi:hypothetical protein
MGWVMMRVGGWSGWKVGEMIRVMGYGAVEDVEGVEVLRGERGFG